MNRSKASLRPIQRLLLIGLILTIFQQIPILNSQQFDYNQFSNNLLYRSYQNPGNNEFNPYQFLHEQQQSNIYSSSYPSSNIYNADPRLSSLFGYQQSSSAYTSPVLNPVQQQAPSQQVNPSFIREPILGGFSVKNGSYVLEWEVNEPLITFRVRRAGTGYVGFAISLTGGMSGADIFIAGINADGTPFANDYHHEPQPGGYGAAIPDASNDYRVISISESRGYTYAEFQRLLVTNDIDDHPIHNTEQNILWAVGPPSRGLEYHGPINRGVVKINLLNPPTKFQLQRSLLKQS